MTLYDHKLAYEKFGKLQELLDFCKKYTYKSSKTVEFDETVSEAK